MQRGHCMEMGAAITGRKYQQSQRGCGDCREPKMAISVRRQQGLQGGVIAGRRWQWHGGSRDGMVVAAWWKILSWWTFMSCPRMVYCIFIVSLDCSTHSHHALKEESMHHVDVTTWGGIVFFIYSYVRDTAFCYVDSLLVKPPLIVPSSRIYGTWVINWSSVLF